MKVDQFHTSFQLNGKSFLSVEELLLYSANISDEIYQFLETWFSTDDFIIVKTSGSTGTPKDIKLEKKQMKNSAIATGDFFDLKENTTALLCLPTEYIAGKMMLVRALILGWRIDFVAPNSFPLRGIKKEYDFSAMVPLQLENSIDSLYKIKKLIVGGGVVSKLLQDKIQSITCAIYATYGMTETITHIAVKKLNNFNNNSSNTIEKPYYRLLPNIEFYKDARNCLVINAPKVSNEIIFTNDIVDLISDNQFDWLGRFDNVINSGGVKLHPEKIEDKLAAIIKNRFFVIGINDDRLGEKLILIIERSNVLREVSNKSLNEKIKDLKTLTKFEVPKEIYFVDQFIETETKKIQRNKTLDLIIG